MACQSKTGPQGPEGPAGPQGAVGPQGPQGPQGDTGAIGATGATGAEGPQGVQGPPGAVLVVDGGVLIGPSGASVVVTPLTAGDTACATGGVRITQLSDGGITNVCNGAVGAQGIQGVQGLQGVPGPQGAQGVPGTSMTATILTVGSVQCATGGVLLGYPDGGSATVCNGAQGAQGTQGPQGVQGAPGTQGIQGVQGVQGPAGAAGVTATALATMSAQCVTGGVLLTFLDGGTSAVCNGAQGASGATGAQGIQGVQGAPGVPVTMTALAVGSAQCPTGGALLTQADGGTRAVCNGSTGATGPVGATGPMGATGPTGPPGSVYFVDGGVWNVNPDVITFAGFTAATYNANLGGFPGANQKCDAEYAGSFLCSYGDYSQSEPTVTPGGTGAWIDGERDSYYRRYTGNCTTNSTSWTYGGSSTSYSASYMNSSGGTGSSLCDVLRPIACCRRARTHVFRGFTVATYTADLGGYPGANAKCSTEYPNSFLCTFGDFSRTEPSSGAGGSGAWIDGERDSYGRRYTGNCTTNSTSWTYGGSSTSYSASYMNATGGTGSSLCNVARPLACCSKN